MSIRVKGLYKSFGADPAVDDVSFEVGDGEFVSLLGPSGSGKSTILRCIAGLEFPGSGLIYIDNQDVTRVSVQERGIGFVFQHYALFRHMTVLENVGFGLKVRGVSRKDYESKARQLIDLVGLKGYETRRASELSGGQRQRVALARALAPEPRLLLLDEPFGALDARLRKGLRSWLKTLHDKVRLTTLMVTHDQEEAFELSHKVIVVNRGKIEQQADPKTIFNQPASEFVARFVGETNRVMGRVHGRDVRWGPFVFEASQAVKDQKDATVLFRPIDVYVSSHMEDGLAAGKILATKFLGPYEELLIGLNSGESLTAHVPKGVSVQSEFATGKHVFVGVTACHVFPPSAEDLMAGQDFVI